MPNVNATEAGTAPVIAPVPRIPRGSRRMAWLVLVAGLMLTLIATLYVKSKVEGLAERDFILHCEEIREALVNRLEDHTRILHSGAAFFDAAEAVTREAWHVFTKLQQIEKQLPGIQGIGFSLLIPRAELAGHIQQIRGEGFPEYSVRPEGDRDLYSSIIYLEPFSGRNLRAFGYDMFSEPVRRDAMERARDTDAAALSGKVILVQETGAEVQAGTLMYVPVYRKGMPTDTVEQRRAAIRGWVYSPYRMNDLLRGALGELHSQKEKKPHFQVFDGPELLSRNLLYDDHPVGEEERPSEARFTRVVPVDFNGHRWTLRFTQTGKGFAAEGSARVWVILVGGAVISLLLFSLIRSLQKTEAEAQRKAEELTVSLRDSEERLRLAIHAAKQGMYDCDFVSGEVIVSPEYLAMMGSESDKNLVSIAQWRDSIHEEDRERIYSVFQECVSGKRDEFRMEYRCRTKSGEVKWLHSRGKIVSRASVGKPLRMLGTFADITSRKQAEGEILDLAFRNQKIIEGTRAGTWEWNIQTGETVFNAIWAKIIGYTLEELAPISINPWGALCHPDDMKLSAQLLERHFSGELPYYDFECRVKHKDGHWVWVHDRGCIITRTEDGKPLMMFGTHMDITERKKAEEALRQANDRLTLAVRAGGVGIWDYDVVNSKLIWDDQMYRLYGITAKTFGGAYDAWQAGLHPEDRQRGDEEIQSALRGEKEFDTEFRVLWPDGTSHNLRALAIVQRDAAGNPTHMVGTNWDITDQKRVEEELLKLAKAKSRFASTVSHELRSPLATIKAATDLVWDGSVGPVNDQQKDLLGTAKSNISRLGRLIDNTLVYQKMEAGKTAYAFLENDLNEVVREVHKSALLFAGNRKEDLVLELAGDLPKINVDKDKLLQVLLNLLHNAVKYSERGNIVTRTRRENNEIHVSVRDLGSGIPAAHLHEIFEPFSQAGSDRKGGTGLGLSIAREIVLAHHGKIWAESEAGKGSTFHFTLPVGL